MKGRPIDQIVYECMFPKPKSGEPQNFHDLLRRHLVPEVRSETACFYGGLDSREAQYPGLDYSYPPHRMRLSRFQWHRRLFRAFDALQLTPSEIAGLTKWEGTRWAKERFEKDEGIKIRDTTGDCIHDWIDPELRQPARSFQQGQEVQVEEMVGVEEETEDSNEDGDESDMEIDSVGLELNQRLRAAAALRDAGNATTVMDAEWEQWLKDEAEAGGIPPLSPQSLPPQSRPLSSHSTSQQSSATTISPRLLNAARLEQWHQIPDFLHNVVRRNVELNNQRTGVASAQQSAPPRRENLIPLTGRSSLRNSNTTSPLNIQPRHQTNPLPAPRRTSLSRVFQAPPSTTSWHPRVQQQPQS